VRTQLAMDIVSNLMDWNDTEATEQFKWLKLMVEYKFDRYQGYGPGIHFYISLIHWLGQFKSYEDRRTAYLYLRKHLVYVGQPEMHQLIRLAMPEMERDARRRVAEKLGIPFYQTWSNVKAKEALKVMSLRTLYVGLSDGARTDIFRRDNEGVLTNEQIVASSEISDEKWKSLGKKLKGRLEGYSDVDCTFERICLIDDFTGSGSTLIRKDDGVWDGKIQKFCEQNANRVQLSQDCFVQIHHYLSSSKAKETIEEALPQFEATINRFSFVTSFSWVLSSAPDVVMSDESDSELLSWIDRHYNSSIQDTHNCKDGVPIQRGYKQCGLPVVLEHNTPNNSIALLWASSKPDGSDVHQMRPLFPRVNRHIDNGQSV